MKKETKQRQPAHDMASAAAVAALYVALMVPFGAISFGPVQFRISEALVILPVFGSPMIPGVTLGCFLGNLLLGAPIPDVVFGSLATLLGAVGTWTLGRFPWAAWIPPVLSNALIIPWVLKYAYGVSELVPYMMVTVGLGEIVAVGLLGNGLRLVLQKHRAYIFS